MQDREKYKIILDVIQAALFQKDIELPAKIEWKEIFQEMKAYVVHKSNQIDDSLFYEWLC